MILLKRDRRDARNYKKAIAYSLEHRNNQKHFTVIGTARTQHLSTEGKDNLFWAGYSKLSHLLCAVTQANAS